MIVTSLSIKPWLFGRKNHFPLSGVLLEKIHVPKQKSGVSVGAVVTVETARSSGIP